MELTLVGHFGGREKEYLDGSREDRTKKMKNRQQ